MQGCILAAADVSRARCLVVQTCSSGFTSLGASSKFQADSSLAVRSGLELRVGLESGHLWGVCAEKGVSRCQKRTLMYL